MRGSAGRTVLVAAFGAALLLGAHAAAAFALDDLLRELAAVPQRHATFEETRHMALVNGPLVRRGTLDYVRPDRLQMRVDTPYFERLDIRGDEVAMERRSGVSRIALSSQPVLAAWVDSLRATLAGDRAALEAHFTVRIDGTLAAWRLTLAPRDPALAAVVERVRIVGHDAEVVRFEVDETKGDTSAIVITPARVQ
jgi:hypothetical protein